MPKLNPYLIENRMKVEEVRYLNTEIPSYEEFLKNYKPDKRVNASYESEINANAELGKGYGPCYYCSYEVNPHKIGGKHIKMCGSLDCSYYRRINYNRAGGAVVGGGVTVASTAGWIAALAATPFTGGWSLALAAGLSTGAVGAAVGGTVLTGAAMKEVLDGVENELRLKWEVEQTRERINKLQSELNEVRRQLREATEKRDEYKRRWGSSDSDYLREKERAERLESQVWRLRRNLCNERGCGCGGYCA